MNEKKKQETSILSKLHLVIIWKRSTSNQFTSKVKHAKKLLVKQVLTTNGLQLMLNLCKTKALSFELVYFY